MGRTVSLCIRYAPNAPGSLDWVRVELQELNREQEGRLGRKEGLLHHCMQTRSTNKSLVAILDEKRNYEPTVTSPNIKCVFARSASGWVSGDYGHPEIGSGVEG